MSKLSKLPLLATVLASGCAHVPVNNPSTENQSNSNQVNIEDVRKEMIQRLGATEEGVQPIKDSDTKYRVVKCEESRTSTRSALMEDAEYSARLELAKHLNNDRGLSEAYITGGRREGGAHERNINNKGIDIYCVLLTAPRRMQHR